MEEKGKMNEEIRAGMRIAFLGDSITDDGRFISYLNAFFMKNLPGRRPNLINLGVGSETASGLSEPDHPFPRPCVLERADRVLSGSRPHWVVICYGMNDGIYYPPDEQRFQAYKDGIQILASKVKEYGARVILVTPPPFDVQSLKGCRLLPAGMDRYSYMEPYEHYEDVLEQYAAWLETNPGALADQVIDIHTPLWDRICAKRQENPLYISGDGIHPDAEGHQAMAALLLKEFFGLDPQEAGYKDILNQSGILEKIMERDRILHDAWKELIGHDNPCKAEALPIDEAVVKAGRLETEIMENLFCCRRNDI